MFDCHPRWTFCCPPPCRTEVSEKAMFIQFKWRTGDMARNLFRDGIAEHWRSFGRVRQHCQSLVGTRSDGSTLQRLSGRRSHMDQHLRSCGPALQIIAWKSPLAATTNCAGFNQTRPSPVENMSNRRTNLSRGTNPPLGGRCRSILGSIMNNFHPRRVYRTFSARYVRDGPHVDSVVH